MLISRVSDGDEKNEEIMVDVETEGRSHTYRTASELFELMSKEHDLDTNDEDSFTQRDLVILYKNIDKGTKLMSHVNELKQQKPNQYVETVVYKDDPESDISDLSDSYSTDDLQDVFSINKERIDFLSSHPSLNNKLCQKIGDINIRSSNVNAQYNNHLLFQDPYVRNQLNAFNLDSGIFEKPLLPASLLDYICCKRLEDDYNFYMDNVIKYVKHTIEQLRRISNGEYLTDRVKEKWKEVDNNESALNKSTKILATSTSIPLHVERKTSHCVSTWDDLIHSEVDVRSLSKILEKKIIIEVPKLICGSLRLISRQCANNLIISCKNKKQYVEEGEQEDENVPRVDLVFELQKSKSGHMISNINSIMILKTPLNIVDGLPGKLPLPYKEIENVEVKEDTLKITEVCKNGDDCFETESTNVELRDTYFGDQESQYDSEGGTYDYPCSENEFDISKSQSCSVLSEPNDVIKKILKSESMFPLDANINVASSEELSLTMQRLNRQMCLPEESGEDLSMETNPAGKKKSPTRVRIKSPYENQSHILEEKKRKRLLEIRAKREKKKLALGESCKINKQKYPKGAVMPQPSNSVTKLSITNKSFYNSIYGNAVALENNKHTGGTVRVTKKDSISEVPLDQASAEGELSQLASEQNSKKYINRSYFLDDAETEIMYTEMNEKENCDMKAFSATTSAISSDFRDNLNLLSELLANSSTDLNKDDAATDDTSTLNEILVINDDTDFQEVENLLTPSPGKNNTPVKSPHNVVSHNKSVSKKNTPSVECRKSIDKIYSLMNKLGQDVTEIKLPVKNKDTSPSNLLQGPRCSTMQASDNGTSVKHHLTYCNPSNSSFQKNVELKSKIPTLQKPEIPVTPKVIINAKPQVMNFDTSKSKKNKKVFFDTSKLEENPLKAISQLLHEFDNVQKIKHKPGEPQDLKKRKPTSPDVKNISRHPAIKRRLLDQHFKDTEILDKNSTLTSPRKPKHVADISKVQPPQSLVERNIINKRKMVDFIEEVKEARGEAVRGPCKLQTRLNSLAQPKKSYVQAHSDEYQTKYGKNTMSGRLQRLAMAQSSFLEKNGGSSNSKNKFKKSVPEVTTSAPMKPRPVPPIATNTRPPVSTSPKGKPLASYKYNGVRQTPETLKKIVAVEEHIKGNYESSSPAAESGEVPGEVRLGHMSRIPLLPKDIASISSRNNVEDSNDLGNTLHKIINNMLNKTSSPLTVDSEHVTNRNKPKNTEERPLQNTLSKIDECLSVNSDYPIDILEDKNIITAVAEDHTKLEESNKESSECCKQVVNSFMIELTNLKKAVRSQTFLRAFQKQSEINVTSIPKASKNLSFLSQSGESNVSNVRSTESVFLKTSLSQSLKIRSYDKLEDIKVLPALSKSDLDWSFIKFPMQIMTVGYAFFDYNVVKSDDSNNIKTLQNNSVENVELINNQIVDSNTIYDQIIKFPKAGKPKGSFEHAVQVDLKEISTISELAGPEILFTTEIKKAESKDLPTPNIETKTKEMNKVNDDIVDYTTSLDMLVGLLNEIQKITTCQTHITKENSNELNCTELETIFNKSAASKKKSVIKLPHETTSVKSLDKLRRLKSNPSIYTFYLSSNKGFKSGITKKMDKMPYRNIYVDKEINADFSKHQTIDRFTEVPSIFPITINHSTNVSKSLIGVLSEPSSQYLFSCHFENKYVCPENVPQKNIIELPQTIIQDELSQISSVHYKKKVKYTKKIDLAGVNIPVVGQANDNVKISKTTNAKTVANINLKRENVQDIDPTLKIKRDILVSVYSILVFTIFAALSFPEMYRF